jgi:NAD-dependent dihydropyrimidine dehydrogenase PreA subunit
MGVRRIEWELCDGCEICVDYCPMDVLRMDERTNKAYIKYLRDCQGCFLCERECPQEAIYCVPIRERRIPLAW